MLVNVCLAVLLLLAVVYDLMSRRIPNWLVFGGMILAMGVNFYTASYSGLLYSLKGLGTGLLLLLIPFALGGMGAGDVKLLGMVGSFKGIIFTLNAFLWMALWGGVIALILLLKKKQLRQSLKRLTHGAVLARLGLANLTDSCSRQELSQYFPYALAIALGVLSAFVKGWI